MPSGASHLPNQPRDHATMPTLARGEIAAGDCHEVASIMNLPMQRHLMVSHNNLPCFSDSDSDSDTGENE